MSFQMATRDLISNLRYRDELLTILGRMGVRGTLRRRWCRWFGPGGGTVRLRVAAQSGVFYVHDDRALEWLKSFGGEEQLLTRVIKALQRGDTFYDVGAEVGLFSAFAAKAVGEEGRVIAFEPEEHRFERLHDNLKLNALKNVRVFRIALSDRCAQGELLAAQPGTAPRVGPARSASRVGRGQVIRMMTGDSIVGQESLPVPQAVKIDVEGHELSVLRGLESTLRKPECRLVCCEVHPRLLPAGVEPGEIGNYLASLGFTRIETVPRPPDFHLIASRGEF